MDPSSPFPRASGTADASVRPAFPEDAAEIARIQVVTWRTAYRSLLPMAVLDDWDADGATESWRNAITAAPTPGHGVLVALEKNVVVGFAAYGPAELTDDERPDPAGPTSELSILIVEPRWGRRGHGSRLLEADRVSAGFYESAGWAPDGWARTLDTGGEPLRELRWHAMLGGDGPEGTP